MKIRLSGTPAEVDLTARLLHEHDTLEIVSESDDYPDRARPGRPPSKLVRRYLEIRL